MLITTLLAALSTQLAQPEAVCVDLRGNQVVPLARKAPKAKATVLIFYLAHCPISRKMTPEINRLYKEFSPKGVRFYMVHEDLTLSREEVAAEAREFGLLPTVVIDKWRSQVKYARAMLSPEAVVYDSALKLQYQGRISNLFYGLGKMRSAATKRDLRDALTAVVSSKAPAVARTEPVGCILPKY